MTPVAADLAARGALADDSVTAAESAGLGVVAVHESGEVAWSDEAYRLHGRPRWRRVRTVDDAIRGVAPDQVAAVRSAYAALPRDAVIDLRYAATGESGQALDLVLRGVDAGIAVVHRAALDPSTDSGSVPAAAAPVHRPRLLLDTGVSGIARSVETIETLEPADLLDAGTPVQPAGTPAVPARDPALEDLTPEAEDRTDSLAAQGATSPDAASPATPTPQPAPAATAPTPPAESRPSADHGTTALEATAPTTPDAVGPAPTASAPERGPVTSPVPAEPPAIEPPRNAELEMASAVLSATPDLVVVYDVESHSTTLMAGVGVGDEDLIAHLSSTSSRRVPIHPSDRSSFERWRAELPTLAPGAVALTEVRFRLGGEWAWRELRATEFHRAEDGELLEAVVVIRDVHERVEAALRLAERERAFREVFDGSPVALAVLDDDGRFTSVNDAFCRLVGRTRENVMSTVYEALVHHEDRAAAVVSRARRVDEELHVSSSEHRVVRSDGIDLWVRVRLSDIDVDGQPLSLVSLEDVTASKAREDQLRHDSLHDALTGLPNRRLLIDRLGRALSRARRTGSRLAVFFIDLDDLKRINDTHPWQHRAGDLLLTNLAVAIRETLRDTDTLARYGGDEFVAVCEDVGDDTTLSELGERILDAVREPITIGSEIVHAGVSIGVAVPESDTESGEDLLGRADGAMYRAKATGGGRVVRADRMHATRDDDDLASALARDELRQLYRPVVSLHTGALLGVRAVLRWRHPHLGTISAQDVRSHLDAGASALPVVNWCLQRAIDDVRTVAPDRVEHLSVWLTMPGRAAAASSTKTALEAALAGADGSLSADSAPSLVLEINEHELASMSRRPALRRHLQELVSVGPIALGVEDLTADTLPIGTLQLVSAASVSLDPELLAAAGENHSTEELVRSLVSAAAALGVITIATRIESQADLDRARHLGVHAVQGDLIGPAAMLDAYTDLLHGGRLALGADGDRAAADAPVDVAPTVPEPVVVPVPAPEPTRRRSLWLVVDEPDTDDAATPTPVVPPAALPAAPATVTVPAVPGPLAVPPAPPAPVTVPAAPVAPPPGSDPVAPPVAAPVATPPITTPTAPAPQPVPETLTAQPTPVPPSVPTEPAAAAPVPHIDLTDSRPHATSPWIAPGVDLADELARELGVEIPMDLATLLARELGVELPAHPR